MDDWYCTIVGLGCWIETALSYGDLEKYVFEIEGSVNKNNIKTQALKYLMDVLNCKGFQEIVSGFVSSGLTDIHSIKKIALTLAQ